MMELVQRAPHREMANDMVGVATIETEAIVLTMLAFRFGEWLEPSVADLHRGTGIDLHCSMGITA